MSTPTNNSQAPSDVTQMLNNYFEQHGRDAFINGSKRVRLLYEGHNLNKRVIVRNSQHELAIGDKIQIDTATYNVTACRVSPKSPYLNEGRVVLKF